MDERRQPDTGPGHAEPSAWRANGAHGAGTPGDHGWSSAGAALEPSSEPLALLTAGQGGGQARHRQPPAPGLDDETPANGLPVTEPPLWREATRHRSPGGYPPFGEYGSAPPAGPAEPGLPAEPAGPEGQPGEPGPGGYPEAGGLPQRVPAEPDVPVSREPEPDAPLLAEPAAGRDRWTAPELAFIADQLRRDDVPGEALTGTFDVDEVVAAVREVPGVEAAAVRTNPTGMHTLRLDLADDADPGQVSRAVARLLLARMGLSASPQDVPQAREPAVAPGSGVPGPASAAPAPAAEAPVEPAPPPGPARAPAPARSPGPALAPEPPRFPTVPTQARGLPDEPRYEQRYEPHDEFGTTDFPVPDLPEEPVPEPVSRPLPPIGQPGPRVVIDQVQVRTFGLTATVEVLLSTGDRQATGLARGPAVDSYLVRLAAVAAAKAIDSLLRGTADPAGPSRCFVEHTGVVGFGNTEVAVVVLLLVCGGWVEQLTGSALVDRDPRQAVVRATLGAVNRRLEALLD